ncbi:MAG: hypothetical protein D6743_19740 [Calditrichaeota bacterium]|nr:MAG: hypothetical protein D6743_19740 [Calditrichota bacterium]
MKSSNFGSGLVLLLLLTAVTPSFSQSDGATLLEEIQNAYAQLNFREAEIKAKAALRDFQRFTPDQLTEVHKILGLVYISKNNPVDARQQFELALSLNPDLELDPLLVSPKILEFYAKVKRSWRAKQRADVRSDARVRYVVVEDPRPAAALRSMLLPGWGQIYKGEKRKGVLLTTLWGIGVAGSIIAHIERQNAEDRYLAEIDPAKIESRFDTFNRWHKVRNSFLVFSAGVWLFSYFDAILREGQARPAAARVQRSMMVLPSISPGRAHLSLLVRF